MEPATVSTAASMLGETAGALKAALEAMPTGGQKHQWHRERRLRAYLEFQRAAHEASIWPVWRSVPEESVLAKEVTMAQVMPDLAACRSAASGLLAALSEIRLVGNPEPRRLAEEITTLLVELMEPRVQGRPPRTIRTEWTEKSFRAWERKASPEVMAVLERIPGVPARLEQARALTDQDAREAQAARFNDCQLALGTWHKKFTLAARKDLGYGPRWWHVSKKPRAGWWQPWRPRDEWPGGWPPPDAGQLVTEARKEREQRHAAQPADAAPAIEAAPDAGV